MAFRPEGGWGRADPAGDDGGAATGKFETPSRRSEFQTNFVALRVSVGTARATDRKCPAVHTAGYEACFGIRGYRPRIVLVSATTAAPISVPMKPPIMLQKRSAADESRFGSHTCTS